MSEVTLAELAQARLELNDAVKLHGQSLHRFWPERRCWFALDLNEQASPQDERSDGRPHHLSTSASCYESLIDRHPAKGRLGGPWLERAQEFSRRALEAPKHEWRSEGAAEVYCRVRALPAAIRFAESLEGNRGEAARDLLVDAWRTVELNQPAKGGVAERALYQYDGSPVTEQNPRSPGYPPNAFLTYWALRTLECYEQRRERDGELPELPDDIDMRARLGRAWASHALGHEAALVLGEAEHSDPQQLAYALATDLRWTQADLIAGTSRYELYRSGLRAFFAKQTPAGIWPRSEPLFHYPESGNAYCYAYETLTELLRPALPRDAGRVFRELLHEHLPGLLRAWQHARDTRVPISDGEGAAFGWSSGHHVFRQDPEGWATASVYSFMQMLRCIVGHLAFDAASEEVRIRRPKEADPDEARKLLRTRGRSWSTDAWTVGRQLASLFLHPLDDDAIDPQMCDPDTPLIAEEDARSAILFGPPGTGKTTLAEALAGALGWHFVEVQAADFLSAGVDAVPARADDIFSALMELDRCVVLFDEIDELIRRREGQETDPFGRFLTTSMLPKIAQLWDQRKVLFFVATNHVAKADPAIRRSSRFDAAILVAPPSLPAKREELTERLDGELPDLPGDKISEALASTEDHHVATEELALGVVALLRHDQIPELADRLRSIEPEKRGDELPKALAVMGDDLLRNEWRPEDKKLPDTEPERLYQLYEVLRGYQDEERKDRSRRRYALVRTTSDGDEDNRGEADAPAAGAAANGKLDKSDEGNDDVKDPRPVEEQENAGGSGEAAPSTENDHELVPAGSEFVRATPRGRLVRVSVEAVADVTVGDTGELRVEAANGTQLVDDGLLVFSPIEEGSGEPS